MTVAKGAPECPVFRPTLADVTGLTFAEYVDKLEKSKAFREAGICKIVAPDGWAPRRQGYNRLNFELPRPIRQHATGRAGLYRTLMVEAKKMRLDEFRDMAREPVNAAPKEAARGGAGERGEGPTPAEREAWAEELERQFWRNVTLNPPLYGADIPGSLFDPQMKGWSLRHLRSLLSETLEAHGVRMPGVNEPYLYVGSWRSVFAWHTEDMDLHSVNYLHCGASKQWYVIPPAHRRRFEQLMRSLLQDLFRACPEFMRHKELLVSPQLLASHAIPVVRVVHNPREFVVVFPGAYHSGFNHGFNIAESVNFATKAWLPVGAEAGYCECQSDSARIDMRLFAEHMPAKLRRQVETMYASSSDDEGDEEDVEEESGSEGSGSEAGEESSSEDGEEKPAPRRRRPRQPRARPRHRRPPPQNSEDDEDEAAAASDWEPDRRRTAKRARGAGAAASAPRGAAAPEATVVPTPAPAPAGIARPQRNRRPPRRDADMIPVFPRPSSALSAGGYASQQPQQQQSEQQQQPSRKRVRPRSSAAAQPAAVPKVMQVGKSSRGRPLLLKVLDSAASLLPFGTHHAGR